MVLFHFGSSLKSTYIYYYPHINAGGRVSCVSLIKSLKLQQIYGRAQQHDNLWREKITLSEAFALASGGTTTYLLFFSSCDLVSGMLPFAQDFKAIFFIRTKESESYEVVANGLTGFFFSLVRTSLHHYPSRKKTS